VAKDGALLWEWPLHEHLDVLSCGSRPCNRPLGDKKWISIPRDWSHVNTVRELPDNRWFRSGDIRFRPGNIILLPRNQWHVLIVDKQTKAVVWKYRGHFDGGLLDPHESYMISEGMPGEGNILIFDNGGPNRRYSIVLEVNPVTSEVVWHYKSPKDFYSRAKGSATRLPNGNTFISSDLQQRAFEVTPRGKVVWEVVSDFPLNRVQRYPLGYCDHLHAVSDGVQTEDQMSLRISME